MSIPTFGGSAIFGNSPVVEHRDIPRERQVNAFFGISGVESLDGGDRGLETTATGLLYGPGEFGLLFALNLFRSYKNGQAYVLVDTLGIPWGNVQLITFNAKAPVHSTPSGQRWCRYEAQFFHLTV